MADSVKLANMARLLAMAHIIVGFLLIGFGIADRVVEYRDSWTGYGYYGIWMGIWMCITGGLGIPGSRREITLSRNTFAGVFMGFSTISAFFGGLIIICYSLSISQYQEKSDDYGTRDIYGYYDRRLRNYHVKMAISVSILLLGIAEFVIGILAPMCCFLMLPCLGGCCACCEAVPQHQGQQIIYAANTTGYVMTQGAHGVPVAIPMQVGESMVPVKASHAQVAQPPMVLVPVSGGVGGQSAMVHVAPTTAIPETVSVPQEAVKPPSYV